MVLGACGCPGPMSHRSPNQPGKQWQKLRPLYRSLPWKGTSGLGSGLGLGLGLLTLALAPTLILALTLTLTWKGTCAVSSPLPEQSWEAAEAAPSRCNRAASSCSLRCTWLGLGLGLGFGFGFGFGFGLELGSGFDEGLRLG